MSRKIHQAFTSFLVESNLLLIWYNYTVYRTKRTYVTQNWTVAISKWKLTVVNESRYKVPENIKVIHIALIPYHYASIYTFVDGVRFLSTQEYFLCLKIVCFENRISGFVFVLLWSLTPKSNVGRMHVFCLLSELNTINPAADLHQVWTPLKFNLFNS